MTIDIFKEIFNCFFFKLLKKWNILDFKSEILKIILDLNKKLILNAFRVYMNLKI